MIWTFLVVDSSTRRIAFLIVRSAHFVDLESGVSKGSILTGCQSLGKLFCQTTDVSVVGSATAPQNLHAELPVQAGNVSSESFRLFFHQTNAVIQFLRTEGCSIGQQTNNSLSDKWR